jgi:hypothetical protein
MKYWIIFVLVMIEVSVSAKSFDFSLVLQSYPYSIQSVTGKKTIANSLYEMQQLDKPAYSPTNLLAQYSLGLAGGLISGYAGGFLAVNLFGGKGDGWADLGYAVLGAYTGFGLIRPYLIHWLGNTKTYRGSYGWTFLTYNATFLSSAALIASSAKNEYYLLLADGIACVVASYVHYLTLKPRTSPVTTISFTPTLLQSQDQTFHGGLKLAVVF